MKYACLMLAMATTVLAAEPQLDNPLNRSSYALGVEMAGGMKEQGLTLAPEAFAAGFKAGTEDTSILTEDEVRTEVMNLQNQVREHMMKQQEASAGDADQNKEAGRKFLADNKTQEGVVETASGLQYKVVKAGSGDARPAATDTVRVHYTGTLLDGTVFDSSVERGEPVVFPLNRVISGWTEGVQLMPVGSTYRFWIPSELAYGDRGAGADIGAGATLIFDVELLEIVK